MSSIKKNKYGLTTYIKYDIIPHINKRKENMQYFILRKTKIGDRVEYETDYKAKKGFKTIDEAIQKKVALETLNDEDHVEYVIVNDGTPTESIIKSMKEDKGEKHSELVDRY